MPKNTKQPNRDPLVWETPRFTGTASERTAASQHSTRTTRHHTNDKNKPRRPGEADYFFHRQTFIALAKRVCMCKIRMQVAQTPDSRTCSSIVNLLVGTCRPHPAAGNRSFPSRQPSRAWEVMREQLGGPRHRDGQALFFPCYLAFVSCRSPSQRQDHLPIPIWAC